MPEIPEITGRIQPIKEPSSIGDRRPNPQENPGKKGKKASHPLGADEPYKGKYIDTKI